VFAAMTFASWELFSFFLLPENCKRENKKIGRCVVQDAEYKDGHTPIFGTMDEIVQVLRERKFECVAHPNCCMCGEAGAYPSCEIGCTSENEFPMIKISFRTCYEYGSMAGTSYHVHACSGNIHDLATLVAHLRLERLALVGDKENAGSLLASHLGNELAGNGSRLKVLELKFRTPSLVVLQMTEKILIRTILQQLDISASGLNDQELDSINTLAAALGYSNFVQILRFSYCTFSDPTMAHLLNCLPASITSLEKLYLNGTQCKGETMTALGGMLQSKHCKLQCLDLSYTKDSLDITPLATGLAHNKSLEHLVFSRSRLVDAGLECLCQALFAPNSTLRTLRLDHCSSSAAVPDNCLARNWLLLLGEALAFNTGLTFLDISHNRDMGRNASAALASGLRRNSNLEHLIARDTFSGKNHVQDLFAALEENTALKTLDVSNSSFSSSVESLSTLAMAMTTNTSLKSLRLGCCEIGNDGASALGIHLPAMKGIQQINLNLNPFDTPGAKELAEGMRENFSLTSLNVATGYGGTLGGPPPELVDDYVEEYITIEFYLKLNRGGRRVLGESLPIPLWPLVLEKAESDYDVIYHLLRQEILLVARHKSSNVDAPF
jgi:Ran GTPase-activating protein (RanGAP) involved in mRNA processing and transport